MKKGYQHHGFSCFFFFLPISVLKLGEKTKSSLKKKKKYFIHHSAAE